MAVDKPGPVTADGGAFLSRPDQFAGYLVDDGGVVIGGAGGRRSQSVVMAPALGFVDYPDGHGLRTVDQRRSGAGATLVVADAGGAGHVVRLSDLELAAPECGADLFW